MEKKQLPTIPGWTVNLRGTIHLNWNYPPTQDASHHQDYSIFSRESLQTFICDWSTGWRGSRPNLYISLFGSYKILHISPSRLNFRPSRRSWNSPCVWPCLRQCLGNLGKRIIRCQWCFRCARKKNTVVGMDDLIDLVYGFFPREWQTGTDVIRLGWKFQIAMGTCHVAMFVGELVCASWMAESGESGAPFWGSKTNSRLFKVMSKKHSYDQPARLWH